MDFKWQSLKRNTICFENLKYEGEYFNGIFHEVKDIEVLIRAKQKKKKPLFTWQEFLED